MSDSGNPLSTEQLQSSPTNLSDKEARALAFLLPLSKDYPMIERWFKQKVVPGLRQGTRLILPIERQGEVVGIGIAKHESDERKICTVRVAPGYVGSGIGVRLFDGLLKWLDDDRPHLTVNATKLPLFERIFDYYGFNPTSAREGLYIPRVVEFGYNERIQDTTHPNSISLGLGLGASPGGQRAKSLRRQSPPKA